MKRTALKLAVTCMVVIGLIFVSIPFLGSWAINQKQESFVWKSCDMSDMKEGELKKCGWAMIYKRTALDKENIKKYVYLLDDPNSLKSKQPEALRNVWRSETPDFFTFKSRSPRLGCRINLKNKPLYDEAPEKVALSELPYFTEFCDGRTWDTSGRLYKREGYPFELNLVVPKVSWTLNTVSIYASQ